MLAAAVWLGFASSRNTNENHRLQQDSKSNTLSGSSESCSRGEFAVLMPAFRRQISSETEVGLLTALLPDAVSAPLTTLLDFGIEDGGSGQRSGNKGLECKSCGV